jgi:hypothetical protein
MTTRLCVVSGHDRVLGELSVCADHYGDIADALTGPSAATDTTLDVVWGSRNGMRMVSGDGVTWWRPRDYRPARIARDYAALGDRLAGQITGERIAASTSAEAPLPLDAAVADLRQAIYRTLASWQVLHVEKFNLNTALPAGATVAQLAAFLAIHRDRAAAQDWAGDYAEELRDLRRRARRLIDLPQPRRVAIARCVETPGGVRCAGTLWLTPREERDTRPVSAGCDTCAVVYTGVQWHRLSKRLVAQAGRMAA